MKSPLMCLQEMQIEEKWFSLKLGLNLPPNNDGSAYRGAVISKEL